MCTGTLQDGHVIQEAYNFNHPLKVIKTAYSGKYPCTCMARLSIHNFLWEISLLRDGLASHSSLRSIIMSVI